MTAHAPAFSAIFACSAFVTSIITPPLSISARPTFTRHSFDPFVPLPLPFGFFASIALLLSFPKCFLISFKLTPRGCALLCALRAAACAFQSSAIPRALPRRERFAFHPGWQIPTAACSAAALARRNIVREQITRRVLSRESAIRWHRIPAAVPATSTYRLPAWSSGFLPACVCAKLHPTLPDAKCRPYAFWQGVC